MRVIYEVKSGHWASCYADKKRRLKNKDADKIRSVSPCRIRIDTGGCDGPTAMLIKNEIFEIGD